MDIGFVWDQEQYKEVQKNHHLQFYEVVSAFDDPNRYEVADPAGHEDRWMWIGRSAHGRVLMVVYAKEDVHLYRLITAFDAERRFRDEYDNHGGI